MADKEDLVKTIIRGRKDVYYLVSDGELRNLKNSSIAADIFFLLSSLSFGAYINYSTAIYIVGGVLFLLLSIIFYYQKIAFIKRSGRSGEIESLNVQGDEDRFRIIRATYGTTSDKTDDITERLKKKISKGGSLSVVASNETAGRDPDPGTVKYLEIEYSSGGVKIVRRYREGDIINLP